MDSTYIRPTVTGGSAIADGYAKAPARYRVRPMARRGSDDSDTWSTSNQPITRSESEPSSPTFPRRILKATIPREAQDFFAMRPTAVREHIVNSPPTRAEPAPPLSPPFPSLSTLQEETETESVSSELSAYTQATSVLSDTDFTPTPSPTKTMPPPTQLASHVQMAPQPHVRVVRRVPNPPATRVKTRLRGRSSAESIRAATQSGRRTVQIQLVPGHAPTHAAQSQKVQAPVVPRQQPQPQPQTQPQPESQQQKELVSDQKKIERTLLEKIDRLEDEARLLRDSQTKLLQDLDDVSERLSVTGGEKRDMEQDRNTERDNRELLRRDLQEQRQILDEFRSNFDLQKGMLDEAERERDSLRGERDELQTRAARLDRELQEKKDREITFVEQIGAMELIKIAMETRFEVRGKEIEDLVTEREGLRVEVAQLQDQVKILTEEKTTVIEERTKLQATVDELEEGKKGLQGTVEGLEGNVDSLKTEVTALEEAKKSLEGRVEALEGEKTEQQSQIDALTIDLAGAKEANVSIASQKLDKETELTKALEDAGAAAKEVNKLKEEAQSLEEELDELNESHDALEADIEKLKGENKSLQTEIDALKAPEAAEEAPPPAAEPTPEPEEPKTEAAPEPAAPSADNTDAVAAAAAAALAALEAKHSTLVDEAAKTTAEKAALEAKQSELQELAAQVPVLTEQNQSLTRQLGEAQVRIEQSSAAYLAAQAEVADLQARLTRLQARSRVTSPSAASGRSVSTSRSKKSSSSSGGASSRSSSSSRSTALVVVRNPQDRGSFQVMRKCDLHVTSPKSSSASVGSPEE